MLKIEQIFRWKTRLIYNASELISNVLCIKIKSPNLKISRICHVIDLYNKTRENFLFVIQKKRKQRTNEDWYIKLNKGI